MAIRLMLAEDMHLIRGALSALLNLQPDLEVVAEVDRGDAIVEAARRHRADVAIIDVDLPGMDGVTAAAQLRESVPSCRSLILTGLTRVGTVRRALAAEVGGFLMKDTSPAELAEAVRKVASGHRVFDPQLMVRVWDADGHRTRLTPRETKVLKLASEGYEPPEIGARLHLSAGTVRNYLTSVVTKLHARNRLDAVRVAREAGLLD
ncbi:MULTISPECIES: response regulator transcription factor [Streptomyces]|uniref:response regulator transcription factor n=1 Tax=Streptomyces TaxID=1883 RepID=UPI00136CFCF7|nr:response regulator transcription factor [Streptomyces sp. SID2888]MYV49786.1 response regulator [Streptomyces sp. SID2888]